MHERQIYISERNSRQIEYCTRSSVRVLHDVCDVSLFVECVTDETLNFVDVSFAAVVQTTEDDGKTATFMVSALEEDLLTGELLGDGGFLDAASR